MARVLVVPVLLGLAFAFAPACTCSKATPPTADGEAGAPVASAVADAAVAPSAGVGDARFSAPIAAARVGGGAVLVAGLVAADKTIAVTRLEPGGRAGFTVTVLRGVAWSQDAELRVFAADGGAVVVWRGVRDGKTVRQMVTLGKGGEVQGEPVDVGAVACSTEDALVWTEKGAGKARVLAKPWAAAPREVASVAAEREPVVVCGAHRVFALGHGEDDITFAIGDADAGAARRLMAASDFGADEERELTEYTVGDDLGVVRVGSGGQVAVREARGDAMGPWKKLTATIPADDDVVAVDGDAKATYVITTREAANACGSAPSGSAPMSVQAMRIDRATFAEAMSEVAAAECGKELGPFWTGAAGGRFVVAWAERASKRDATSAPIVGLAYRVLDGEGAAGGAAGAVVRIARAADALVDAGCDKDRCYAVALAREPGTTNMVPEAAQILTYP
jgi:hypothetical protein